MPVCSSVLMSGNRKAIRASQKKRAEELARADKEIQRLEGNHENDPDDRKRR